MGFVMLECTQKDCVRETENEMAWSKCSVT